MKKIQRWLDVRVNDRPCLGVKKTCLGRNKAQVSRVDLYTLRTAAIAESILLLPAPPREEPTALPALEDALCFVSDLFTSVLTLYAARAAAAADRTDSCVAVRVNEKKVIPTTKRKSSKTTAGNTGLLGSRGCGKGPWLATSWCQVRA
jgi:hypothetical protein